MKVAYVVPRYGPQVRGGAETGARMFAERLVSMRGWAVEVFTTAALDALTWRDELAPGTEMVNGVTVHRFASAAGRDEGFHPYWAGLRDDPGAASAEAAQRFVDLQGPVTPDLVGAVAAGDADVVVFYPYLYYPTVRGLPRVPGRSVLHPAAHGEPVLGLRCYPPVFEAAAGLVLQTESEQALVAERFSVAATPQVLVGLGVDRPAGPGRLGAAAVVDGPYLLCLGRVDDHKGSGLLARYFGAYKARHAGPLRLVFAGPVIDDPGRGDDVMVLGEVDEATKWALIDRCTALVSPSPWEAFSIVVIEAMSSGRPVLVNAACGATMEHCRHSGAGLWFAGYAEFEAGLDRLVGDAGLVAAMGERGRAYVATNYTWPVIIDRYGAFLARIAGGSGGTVV